MIRIAILAFSIFALFLMGGINVSSVEKAGTQYFSSFHFTGIDANAASGAKVKPKTIKSKPAKVKKSGKGKAKQKAKFRQKPGKKSNKGKAKFQSKKPVVLGETMVSRVNPVAKKIGANVYNPNKNIKPNPNRQLEKMRQFRNQKQWINRQIKSNRPIYDIGKHRNKPKEKGKSTNRSDFYKIETQALKKAGYSRNFVKNVGVNINGTRKIFRLYEWRRK